MCVLCMCVCCVYVCVLCVCVCVLQIKSTNGYDFDFRCASGLSKYDPLRDSHLKKYFNRPHMLKRLIRRK